MAPPQHHENLPEAASGALGITQLWGRVGDRPKPPAIPLAVLRRRHRSASR